MYYKKYFSGSLDATSTSSAYRMGLDKNPTETSYSNSHIKNKSDVIGNAVVSTLQDIGYTNAYWDSTSAYLFIDKTNSLCGFYIDVQSSYIQLYEGKNDATNISLINSFNISVSKGYLPFSVSGATACEYQFYVTAIGEPTGILQINIGSYSNISFGYVNFIIAKGIDKRDNSNVYILDIAGNQGIPSKDLYNSFSVYDYSANQLFSNISIGLSNSTLTLKDETIVLIPLFFKYGYIVMDNTYINPGISAGFYEIDGNVYLASSYYMTKCVTEI